jgi:hypothetical protein
MLSTEVKRTIPIIITFILGILVVTDFYVVSPALRELNSIISNMAVVVTAFAFLLAGVSLTISHGSNIMKRGKNWVFSAFLLIMLWVMVGVGLVSGTDSSTYTWLWDTFYTRIYQIFYGMWVFFYTSAIYRSFRFRSLEAAAIIISGVLMLLGNAAIGGAIWSGFPAISTWIMAIPTAAALRGIVISAALGYIATAIRTMIGYERGYLGEE